MRRMTPSRAKSAGGDAWYINTDRENWAHSTPDPVKRPGNEIDASIKSVAMDDLRMTAHIHLFEQQQAAVTRSGFNY